MCHNLLLNLVPSEHTHYSDHCYNNTLLFKNIGCNNSSITSRSSLKAYITGSNVKLIIIGVGAYVRQYKFENIIESAPIGMYTIITVFTHYYYHYYHHHHHRHHLLQYFLYTYT